MPPTVAVIDHFDGGHHPTYLRLWRASLDAHGLVAHIISPRAVSGVPCNRTHLIPRSRSQVLAKDRGSLAPIRLWMSTNQWIDQVENSCGQRVDAVVLPYADPWILHNTPRWILDRFITRPWAGLLFRCPATILRRADRFGLSGIASRRGAAIAMLDGLLAGQAWPKSLPIGQPIELPDIAETISEQSVARSRTLRREFAVHAGDRPIIACVGRITRRKNILALLRAVDRWSGANRPFVVLAGETAEHDLGDHAPILRAWFNIPANGWARWNRLDDQEFNAIIAAADMVWACYSDFSGSSNMIAKAAQCRVSVLVNPGGAAGAIAVGCAHACIADTTSEETLRRSIAECATRHKALLPAESESLRARFGVGALHRSLQPLAEALHRVCATSLGSAQEQ